MLGDDGYYKSFVSKDYPRRDRCPASAGCRDVLRSIPPAQKTLRDNELIGDNYVDDDEDDSNDYRYSPKSQEENESFEYQSDEDLAGNDEEVSDGNMETSRISDIDSEEEPMKISIKAVSDEEPRRSLDVGTQATNPHMIPPQPEDGLKAWNEHPQPEDGGSVEASPHEDMLDNISESWSERDKLEHLAGPRCEHHGGYSGFEISAEEMEGCTVAQCIVRKSPDWQPEPDDLDFELSGDYFLSGLIGCMPSRDTCYSAEYTPIRHGCEDLFPDTELRHDVSHDV